MDDFYSEREAKLSKCDLLEGNDPRNHLPGSNGLESDGWRFFFSRGGRVHTWGILWGREVELETWGVYCWQTDFLGAEERGVPQTGSFGTWLQR